MKRKTILLMFAAIMALCVCLVSPSMAQIKNTFVRLGNGVPGVLYEPVTPTPPKSEIAIVVMHTGSDYLAFSAGADKDYGLAARGYRVLCANPSTSKSGFITDNDINQILSEVKLAVKWLRDNAGKLGIKKVVLLGHSGGGGLMSAYQNIAENGVVKACQGPEKIVKCPDSLAGLPPADGLMLLDSTFGSSGMALFSVDPAAVSEVNAQAVNPILDMYNPANGFDPDGYPYGSTYTGKFRRQFFAKQKERNNQLIAQALDRLKKIEAGKGRYIDDEPFIVPGGSYKAVNNKLFMQDLSLWQHTRGKYKLLTKDGPKGPQIVYSVRVPAANTESPVPSLNDGALTTRVRAFLSTFSVRALDGYGYDEDSIYGIDYASSYYCTPYSVSGITVPLLQLGMTGSHEYFMAETIYEHAASTDKELAYVEGARHNFTTCTACEDAWHTSYGTTLDTTYSYVDSWLSKPGRFLP